MISRVAVFYFRFSTLAALVATTASGQSLPPANPISASMPTSAFSLQLEELLQLPDSGSGTNRYARVEQMSPAVDGSGSLFVADQRGKVYTFTPGDAAAELYYDFGANISRFASGNGQSGLRGFAFHPNALGDAGMPGYGKMYLAYEVDTRSSIESHQSMVSEWTLDASGDVVDGSKRDLLLQSQPRGDHNIGKLGFNPSLSPGDADYGNLYISFGDGGNYRLPNDSTLNPNGQDTTNYLGSMLRINPLESGGDAYTVPSDNPFLGEAGIEPEIWAYGLRNPHQFSWDSGGNGDMLIADIGQSNIEEINLGVAGANYGWSIREGTFDMTGKAPDNPISADVLPANHVTDPYTYPVVQYDHDFDNDNGQENAAIAGGFVYRGSLIPELRGKYVFGNFGSAVEYQDIFIVDVDELQLRDDFSDLSSLHDGFLAPVQRLNLVDANNQPTSLLEMVRDNTGNNTQTRADIRFGIDADGEIYISSKKDGWIRRFASTLIPGDYNRDGYVDAADFTIWRDTLDQSLDLRADGNGDGVVDADDHGVWVSNFGSSNFAPAAAVVPEPSSNLQCIVALFGLLLTFRRSR